MTPSGRRTWRDGYGNPAELPGHGRARPPAGDRVPVPARALGCPPAIEDLALALGDDVSTLDDRYELLRERLALNALESVVLALIAFSDVSPELGFVIAAAGARRTTPRTIARLLAHAGYAEGSVYRALDAHGKLRHAGTVRRRRGLERRAVLRRGRRDVRQALGDRRSATRAIATRTSASPSARAAAAACSTRSSPQKSRPPTPSAGSRSAPATTSSSPARSIVLSRPASPAARRISSAPIPAAADASARSQVPRGRSRRKRQPARGQHELGARTAFGRQQCDAHRASILRHRISRPGRSTSSAGWAAE